MKGKCLKEEQWIAASAEEGQSKGMKGGLEEVDIKCVSSYFMHFRLHSRHFSLRLLFPPERCTWKENLFCLLQILDINSLCRVEWMKGAERDRAGADDGDERGSVPLVLATK